MEEQEEDGAARDKQQQHHTHDAPGWKDTAWFLVDAGQVHAHAYCTGGRHTMCNSNAWQCVLNSPLALTARPGTWPLCHAFNNV